MKSFFSFRILLVAVASLATASCGFQPRGHYNLPAEIKTLSITSFDEYGQLKREMSYQLKLHDIYLVSPREDVANLHLKGEGYGESTLSLYQNSRVAEKQFNYSVNYAVTLPEQGSYNFSTSLSRTYLDNPLTALAKSVEEEMLAQEMRMEAIKQIIRQLARLKAHVEKHKTKLAEEEILNESYSERTEKDQEISIETRFEENKVEKTSLKNSNLVPENQTVEPISQSESL